MADAPSDVIVTLTITEAAISLGRLFKYERARKVAAWRARRHMLSQWRPGQCPRRAPQSRLQRHLFLYRPITRAIACRGGGVTGLGRSTGWRSAGRLAPSIFIFGAELDDDENDSLVTRRHAARRRGSRMTRQHSRRRFLDCRPRLPMMGAATPGSRADRFGLRQSLSSTLSPARRCLPVATPRTLPRFLDYLLVLIMPAMLGISDGRAFFTSYHFR